MLSLAMGFGLNMIGDDMSGVQVLARSAVAVSCGADTTEDVLATITVPPGALGPNGVVRIRTRWTWTNGANSKTPRIRFSGPAGTIFLTGSVTANNGASLEAIIANRGVANAQVGISSLEGSQGYSAQALVTSAVDTTAATTIVVTGQKASAGDAMTLEAYVVELLYGA